MSLSMKLLYFIGPTSVGDKIIRQSCCKM